MAMNGTFSYNTANGQATSATATGFYHVPLTSGFQFHQNYQTAVQQNGALTAGSSPTAFTNVISSRIYQDQTHGIMQSHDQYTASGMTVDHDHELRSIDSDSESRTPTQSDQLVSGSVQTRKRRRGVIEKRRRDRINTSLAELRRLVPAAFEKQGSQKLEKAEILQMTVDHLRFINSKGFDSWWRDQQRYASEYYSMGFRVCIGEVDTFLSKEGMDMHDPLRLRLMSHLQCAGVQRQSAFNIWTPSQQHPSHNQYHSQPSYWTSTAAVSPAASAGTTGLQYAVYSMIPPPSDIYANQTLSTLAVAGNQQSQENVSNFKDRFNSTQGSSTSFSNGTAMTFAPVSSAASSLSTGIAMNTGASNY